MAHRYVRSGATGSGTGADWANAFTTLAAALTAGAAGDNFWVSEDHAETQASALALGLASLYNATVVCVDHAGSVPPVAADFRTTATVTTTGANTINAAFNNMFVQGITFSSGSGAVTNAISLGGGGCATKYKNCNFIKAGTSANVAAIVFGGGTGGSQSVYLENCKFGFGNVGDSFAIAVSRITIKNQTGLLVGAITPTVFFNSMAAGSITTLESVDINDLGGNTLYGNAFGNPNVLVLKNCKLGASMALSANSFGPGENSVQLINCDSGSTNYRNEKYAYAGIQLTETTIVRTGGASDGTTPVSWKITTTANSKWLFPFECPPIAVWNDTTAANKTITVYGVWGGGAVPNNDEIWIEVSYMGSSATPIATINTTNTKADFLAANAAQASDSSTWGGSIGSPAQPFKMQVTLSAPQPAMKGPIYVTVKAARASSTFYIDPKIEIS